MTHLAKQFEAKTSEREYIALVWGNVEEEKELSKETLPVT
jgi:23S rRNA pseudouridine1911/1915/1917 synthase